MEIVTEITMTSDANMGSNQMSWGDMIGFWTAMIVNIDGCNKR